MSVSDSIAMEEALGPLNPVERKNSPSSIFYRGNLALVREPRRISLVGSREASPRGLEAARRIAKELAKNRIVVVSGLAKGIDAASHAGSIEAGGHTIAVIGTPLNEYYPKENRALQDAIARDHLLISQFP